MQHCLQMTHIAKLRLLVPLCANLQVARQQYFTPFVILVHTKVPLFDAFVHMAGALPCVLLSDPSCTY